MRYCNGSCFINYIQHKGREKGRISLSERRSSSKKIVQLVQRQGFSEEIDSLSKGRSVKCQSKLANLVPVLIEGTLCMGGRICHAPITFSAAHPMLLPKDHLVSSLIVCHYHELLGHTSREHVIISGLFKLDHSCAMFCRSVSIVVNKTKRP